MPLSIFIIYLLSFGYLNPISAWCSVFKQLVRSKAMVCSKELPNGIVIEPLSTILVDDTISAIIGNHLFRTDYELIRNLAVLSLKFHHHLVCHVLSPFYK